MGNASLATLSFPQPAGRPGVPAAGGAFLAPPAPAPTLTPAILNVDLHKCIMDNMPLWKTAWAPVFEMVSAVASGSESMASMVDVQLAMTRCNISQAMESILLDSVEAGKLHANLMPEGLNKNGSVQSLLASALEDFEEGQWYAFGKQLGVAMQDMLVVSFDQKYEVDADGSLRQHFPDAGQLANRQSLVAIAVGALSVSFLGMFALARSRRAGAGGRGFELLDRAQVFSES